MSTIMTTTLSTTTLMTPIVSSTTLSLDAQSTINVTSELCSSKFEDFVYEPDSCE